MAKKVWTPAARRAFAEKMRKARAARGIGRKRRANPGRAAVHTKKFDRTVRKVKKSLRKYHRKGNAYAITEQALGKKRSIRKAHRRVKNPSQHFIIGVRTPEGLFYVTRGAGVLTSSHAKANRYATIGAAQGVGETLARWVPRNYKVAVYRDR